MLAGVLGSLRVASGLGSLLKFLDQMHPVSKSISQIRPSHIQSVELHIIEKRYVVAVRLPKSCLVCCTANVRTHGNIKCIRQIGESSATLRQSVVLNVRWGEVFREGIEVLDFEGITR
ncbi:hypothetical protein CRM22_010752 [Opisthorchis felineus]|uniref:Uncharacterized protein n=1 Tax=Opisthorchis felineus TaxID=147828 RepID=A0A4S2KNV4_OPIFE|nr:hypothetical protein CRM22_010752 [Opisthorchis felineus]